jgi:23S rRNA pseudouridine1911/1915/1917 synthase
VRPLPQPVHADGQQQMWHICAGLRALKATSIKHSLLRPHLPRLPPPWRPVSSSMSMVTLVVVGAEERGGRLDNHLACNLGAQLLPPPSRSRVKRVIKAGGVTVNGRPILKPSAKLRPKDKIGWDDSVDRDDGAGDGRQLVHPEDIPLHVYHEDEQLIVLEKPAGMAVRLRQRV